MAQWVSEQSHCETTFHIMILWLLGLFCRIICCLHHPYCCTVLLFWHTNVHNPSFGMPLVDHAQVMAKVQGILSCSLVCMHLIMSSQTQWCHLAADGAHDALELIKEVFFDRTACNTLSSSLWIIQLDWSMRNPEVDRWVTLGICYSGAYTSMAQWEWGSSGAIILRDVSAWNAAILVCYWGRCS